MYVYLRQLNATVNAGILIGGTISMAVTAQLGTPLPGTQVWKVSYLINLPSSGWSSTWYFAQNNNALTPTLEQIFLDFWTLALNGGITKDCKLAAIRYSLVGSPQVGDIIDGVRAGGSQSGQAAGATVYPNLAWYFTAKDPSGNYRKVFYMHGITTNWNTWDPLNQGGPSHGPGLDNWVSTLVNFLTSPPKTTSAIGSWGMRAWAKETPPRVTDTPGNIMLDPDGRHFRCSFSTITPAIGDLVQFSRVKGAGTAGLNGRHLITNIYAAAAPLPQMYQIGALSKCGTNVIIQSPGKVYTSVYRAYAYGTIKPNRQGTRKVGRPFFLTHGKVFSKRC